jgi:hypothetical protein
MRPTHLLSFSLLITFAACTSQQEDAADTNTPAATAPPATPATTITSAPVEAQAPAASTGAVADPNPPHGEPGHRCEIPVGESLSGAAPAATPASQQMTMPAAGTPAATAGSTPPGMNPPHGEPGHDCAVPVGSPLTAK